MKPRDPQTLAEVADLATISPAAVSRLTGLGRNGVYLAIQHGELPSIRCGRRILVPVPAFFAWMGVPDGWQTRGSCCKSKLHGDVPSCGDTVRPGVCGEGR